MMAEYKVRNINAYYFPDRHAILQWPSFLAHRYGAKESEHGRFSKRGLRKES